MFCSTYDDFSIDEVYGELRAEYEDDGDDAVSLVSGYFRTGLDRHMQELTYEANRYYYNGPDGHRHMQIMRARGHVFEVGKIALGTALGIGVSRMVRKKI